MMLFYFATVISVMIYAPVVPTIPVVESTGLPVVHEPYLLQEAINPMTLPNNTKLEMK